MRTALKRAVSGVTLVEIMIVVAVVGLLAAIAIPNFVSARATSQANACINNLRQIQYAVDQMAVERGLATGATYNFPADILPYLRMNAGGGLPACPAGGVYGGSAIGAADAACSLGSTVTPAHALP